MLRAIWSSFPGATPWVQALMVALFNYNKLPAGVPGWQHMPCAHHWCRHCKGRMEVPRWRALCRRRMKWFVLKPGEMRWIWTTSNWPHDLQKPMVIVSRECSSIMKNPEEWYMCLLICLWHYVFYLDKLPRPTALPNFVRLHPIFIFMKVAKMANQLEPSLSWTRYLSFRCSMVLEFLFSMNVQIFLWKANVGIETEQRHWASHQFLEFWSCLPLHLRKMKKEKIQSVPS